MGIFFSEGVVYSANKKGKIRGLNLSFHAAIRQFIDNWTVFLQPWMLEVQDHGASVVGSGESFQMAGLSLDPHAVEKEGKPALVGLL